MEGNWGSQDHVCTIYWDSDKSVNFKKDRISCENDEARSGFLEGAVWGTTITLYDHPDGKRNDDYTVIKVSSLF